MFTSLKKRFSRSISRAGELLSGPTPAKQFRNAIMDGDEEKAISLYNGDQPDSSDQNRTAAKLSDELHPSKPFPTKKDQIADSPLYLAVRHALQKLVIMLLERGGNPSVLNARHETCLHAVCSMTGHPETRAQLLEVLYNWEGVDEEGVMMDKVSLNKVDVDGNTAIHYAGAHGLVLCVERLVALGAIISIVNKTNITCCEMADEANHKDLALMLELALVFQPEDVDLASFDRFAGASFVSTGGRLYLDTPSLTAATLQAFVEECISVVARRVGWMNARHFRSRAEQLLNNYAWDVERLVAEYLADAEKVLTDSKMLSPSSTQKEAGVGHVESPDTAKRLFEDAAPVAAPTAGDSETAEDKTSVSSEVIDLGDISLEAVATVETPESTVCTICGDDMLPACDLEDYLRGAVQDVDRRALSCNSGHTFCVTCWTAHLSVQLNDHAVGCIPCLGFKCGEILDFDYAQVLLPSAADRERLLNARMRHIVDYAGMKLCPHDNCGLVLCVPSESKASRTAAASPPSSGGVLDHNLPTAALCSNGHLFCLQCSSVAHSPASCADHLHWQKLVAEELKNTQTDTDVDDIANAMWVAANTKRCPRCGTAIEKDEGCNHMNCRKCRKEFCWICMQDWSMHSDNTGGYFQCNRFVDQAAARTTSEDALMAGAGWVDERGNAHAEAMRSRERNRRMARFIHHFTRHKAHGDSKAMECKMHKETLRRIGDGLLACREGQLKWLQGDLVPNPLAATTPAATCAPVPALTPAPVTPARALTTAVAPGQFSAAACQPCISFLHEGFEELHRCRSFLEFSYVYAYFEFMDNDDYDYQHDRRRNRWSRARLDDHRTSFEMLQADLESSIETLSDVCARRRLRASESQITQATRAAKQKRVEFESLLIAYSSVKLQTQQAEAAAPQRASGARGAFSPTPAMFAAAARRGGPTTRFQRRGPRPADEPADDYNMEELANLLLELELAQVSRETAPSPVRTGRTVDDGGAATPAPAQAPTPAPPPPTPAAAQDAASAAATPAGSAAPPTPPNTQVARGQTLFDRLGALLGSPAAPEETHEPATPLAPPSPARSVLGESLDSEASSDGEEDVQVLTLQQRRDHQAQQQRRNDERLLLLAQRAEEAADLNRAILMSLQDPPHRADGGTVPTAADPEHVAALEAMGFSKDRAEQALRETRGDLELAANRLLGAES